MSASVGGDDLPRWAYVPGRTPRHAEGAFEALKAGLSPGAPPAALAASPALTAGLLFLDRGYFWEAHEVLEAVWLAARPNSAERAMIQALIQAANAGLKTRMERPAAARRLAGMARAHLAEARRPGQAELLGLDLDAVARRIECAAGG